MKIRRKKYRSPPFYIRRLKIFNFVSSPRAACRNLRRGAVENENEEGFGCSR